MDRDFLKKEEEFRKENSLLEQKTKELLRRVDDLKKFQEYQYHDYKPEVTITSKELNLPKSVDEMGTKGMIQFYKSKIKTLQNDLEKSQSELRNKSEELKKIQKDHQTVSEDKEKWFLQYNAEKNNASKLEKQIAACNSKIQIKENENASLKKEIDQLKSEVKNSSNESATNESKLKRALQEVEKLKTTVKNMRQDQKESREMYQNSLKELNATVKQIQKHKNELLQGYKKQTQLIDNLKRQKTHLESCKVLELAEGEFFKILDWKLE